MIHQTLQGVTGSGQGLHRVLGAPRVEPALQGYSIDALQEKPLRHTDASRFIRSGAVGDHKPVIEALG